MAFRYQALGPLQAGEGSRAFLGLAVSEDNKARPVVIIWVPEAAQTDATLLAKIQRETEHAAKLDHPNIVSVLGFASLEEGNARVVEFADGESLRKIAEAGKKLPARIAAKLICDACTGVHYAHIAGNDDGVPLVHGDLRPETMLISFSGVTKITGYGALAFAPRDIGGQRVKGRRVHSAPEQIIGGREAISIPTDVYLLGLTLYECLTGIVPYADQGDYFDHAVLTLPLPPAPPGDVSPELEKVIIKACAKKALERYPHPLALREAIEAAVGRDIATTEEVSTYLESLFPESHDLRAARRHTIDAGIADFVRRQWASSDKAPVTQQAMPAIKLAPPPVAMLRAAPPMPTQKAPVVAFASPDEDDDEKRESSMGWVVFAAVIVAGLGIWYFWHVQNRPLGQSELREDPVSSRSDSVDAAVVALIDPSVAVRGSNDSGASLAIEAAPVVDASVAATAALANPVVAANVAVDLDASPPVDVVIDGEVKGRTPWHGSYPPGRRPVSLVNKPLGINTGRVLMLRAGENYSTKFTFEKGTVAVNAPEGAVIYIDNVKMGVAPLKADLSVYEGGHRIMVMVGESKWSEGFNMLPQQRVNFDVNLE